jgi:6-phosphogluconolactonase
MAAAGFRTEAGLPTVAGSPDWQEYQSRVGASAAAAALLAELLRIDLGSEPKASASLVVSGGSTPAVCFEFLSTTTLDWSKVTVLPSDERWVPPGHEDSNERLVRSTLLRGTAQAANFLPLYRPVADPAAALALIESDLASVKRPFSAVLLGMGEDGHFASLFPDFPGLGAALDPENPLNCVLVHSAASPHPRISLTLSAMLDSNHIVLLIFGEAKRRVLELSLADKGAFPAGAVLQQIRSPVTVIWAA